MPLLVRTSRRAGPRADALRTRTEGVRRTPREEHEERRGSSRAEHSAGARRTPTTSALDGARLSPDERCVRRRSPEYGYHRARHRDVRSGAERYHARGTASRIPARPTHAARAANASSAAHRSSTAPQARSAMRTASASETATRAPTTVAAASPAARTATASRCRSRRWRRVASAVTRGGYGSALLPSTGRPRVPAG